MAYSVMYDCLRVWTDAVQQPLGRRHMPATVATGDAAVRKMAFVCMKKDVMGRSLDSYFSLQRFYLNWDINKRKLVSLSNATETPIIALLVKKWSVGYGTRRFIAVSTRARHLSLLRTERNYSFSLRSILYIPFYGLLYKGYRELYPRG
jgi:hypothetical protein